MGTTQLLTLKRLVSTQVMQISFTVLVVNKLCFIMCILFFWKRARIYMHVHSAGVGRNIHFQHSHAHCEKHSEYTHMYACMQTHMHARMHARTHTHTHTHTHMHVTSTHTCTHTCTHAHVHMHTHTYTHTNYKGKSVVRIDWKVLKISSKQFEM